MKKEIIVAELYDWCDQDGPTCDGPEGSSRSREIVSPSVSFAILRKMTGDIWCLSNSLPVTPISGCLSPWWCGPCGTSSRDSISRWWFLNLWIPGCHDDDSATRWPRGSAAAAPSTSSSSRIVSLAIFCFRFTMWPGVSTNNKSAISNFVRERVRQLISSDPIFKKLKVSPFLRFLCLGE